MRKRVRFLGQWTLKTRSDHLALFVLVEIRARRKGRWKPLLLVSVNMGGKFGPDDLWDVIDQTRGTPTVICLQEGGDQAWVPRWARVRGLRYVGGNHLGEASTAMVVSPGIEIHEAVWRQVVGRVKVGDGAGPSRSKWKGWHKTRMSLQGVHFGVTSWHQYASQQRRRRLLWSYRLAAPIVAAVLRMARPFFLVGDTNSATGQPLRRWLIRHGMTSNHDALGRINTHGGHDIDAVLVQTAMVATPGGTR